MNKFNPIAKGLQSPRLLCRIFGCTNYVPSTGCYPGMPQAYCYYCGMRQVGAEKGAPDVFRQNKFQPGILEKLFLR